MRRRDFVALIRLSLLLSTCLLSACATPHWVKPEASKNELAQDQVMMSAFGGKADIGQRRFNVRF